MSRKVFTEKFNYNMPTGELKKIMPLIAPEFSKIPGCIWKIWLINEDQQETGGVFLFESDMDLERYLASDLFISVEKNPAFSNFQTNIFSVAEDASAITGAPLFKAYYESSRNIFLRNIRS
jgi:hypothetical protein